MFGAYPLFNNSRKETIGGSEVELFKLANYLAGIEGIEVDFIVGEYSQKKIETINNIRLIKVKYMRMDKYQSLKHKLLRYLYLFKVLLTQKSDIYITKTASELLGWMILVLKLIRRKKVVFRLGSDKDAEPEFWKNHRRLYHLYKFGLKHCDKVYVQSSNQQEALKANCGIRSYVVKNVFNIENKMALGDKDYILWVSRCDPLKRPQLFIELARNLPEERFLIIMPYEQRIDKAQDECLKKIISDVRSASCELGNLEYIESVPFDKIQPYYDAAKLFVNTSEYEGFPNSFIQACIGKTGILSYRVNPDNFLTQYGAGFCCDDDTDKAVAIIKSLDDKRIEEIGNKAYAYAVKNHDVRHICKGYISDFLKLLDKEKTNEDVSHEEIKNMHSIS